MHIRQIYTQTLAMNRLKYQHPSVGLYEPVPNKTCHQYWYIHDINVRLVVECACFFYFCFLQNVLFPDQRRIITYTRTKIFSCFLIVIVLWQNNLALAVFFAPHIIHINNKKQFAMNFTFRIEYYLSRLGFSTINRLFILLFVLVCCDAKVDYSVPLPKAEVLSPRGFRIWIPGK